MELVRDYCESCDHIPLLGNFQGDLKDFQRPWTVKAILGTCSPGAKLLEIGAGEPIAAQMLTELGYQVIVVDPYDGSGRGPREYEDFRRIYAGVTIHRASFNQELAGIAMGSLDCIYSISVLEHLSGPALFDIFAGIRAFLKPRGVSLHSIDHVAAGQGAEFHHSNLIDILNHQSAMGANLKQDAAEQVECLERHLRDDVETFYLSPSGHNLWRGGLPYDQFPFRKVVSILSCVRMPPQ